MHPNSNFRTANDTFLSRVPIPNANIHRISAEVGGAAAAAELYQDELVRFFSLVTGETPRFDLVLLGSGATDIPASLFPGAEVLRRDHAPGGRHDLPETGASRISYAPGSDHARAVVLPGERRGKAEVLVASSREGREAKRSRGRCVRPRGLRARGSLDRGRARLLHPRPQRTAHRPAPSLRLLEVVTSRLGRAAAPETS